MGAIDYTNIMQLENFILGNDNIEIDKKDINEQLDRNIDNKKNDQIDSDNNIIL